MNNKVHIVSNRLPIEIKTYSGKLLYKQSIGGLATGLQSLSNEQRGYWFGWPGIASNDLSKSQQKKITEDLLTEKSVPIFLNREELNGYYSGFANQTLNPLFHYFPQHVVYSEKFFDTYEKVNQIFADAIIKKVKPHDTVWIHDYHLFLLPALLRKALPNLSIGFFLHIPFPSSELFRILPWREKILDGILGADLIGFHTQSYVRHFLQSIQSIKGIENHLGWLDWQDRLIKTETFPMGIDYQHFHDLAKKAKVNKSLSALRKKGVKIILSVDRLDYTKGILQKLKALEELLRNSTKYRKKLVLVLIVAPSRSKLTHYSQLKREIDEIVGRINGKYSTFNWSPIWYLSQTFTESELVSFYKVSDVLLITSFRDGMNLIAKEFVASKIDKKGAIVLSERTGVAKEMPESLSVNPNDIKDITNKIIDALEMSAVEQKQNMISLQKRLAYYNINWWFNSFIRQLKTVKQRQQHSLTHSLSTGIKNRLLIHYREAKSRLILLDYDGTLVPFKNDPKLAIPSDDLLKLLTKIARDEKNTLAIVSGRTAHFLEHYFGHLPVLLFAEHGLMSKDLNDGWIDKSPNSQDWRKEILPIFQLYVDSTPGSFIEKKEHSLVWQYRKVDRQLSKQRVKELKDDLRNFTVNYDLSFIDGNKVLEVKTAHVNKGSVLQEIEKEGGFDFLLAIGDDQTDEDLFEQLSVNAYSIKVGTGNTKARFRVKDSDQVISLLGQLDKQKPR